MRTAIATEMESQDAKEGELLPAIEAFAGFMQALDRSALDRVEAFTSGANEASASQAAVADKLEALKLGVAEGQHQAAAVQAEVAEASQSLLGQIDDQLAATSRMLTEKQSALETVLHDVEQVASRLSLLAVNASIEAARAGEAGVAFAVVAKEVQRLANQALDQARRAAGLIDISDVIAAQDGAIAVSRAAAENTNTAVEEGFDAIGNAFARTGETLDQVLGHAGTMARSMNEAMDAIEHRLSWSVERSGELQQALSSGTEREAQAAIQGTLARDGIPFAPGFDRLDDILLRGKIRVAIEPAFIGLSFRLAEDEPLIGMDVDYAKALANHLGVDCEFVEAPWDTLTELLHIGPAPGQAPADIVLSALPPDPSYRGVAYSETYTYLHWVLARRYGDTRINGIDDLEGMTVGIINDPGAYQVLEAAGLRWPENANVPGGRVILKSLTAYSDQSRIHDCLADGDVDAFGVDLPIYHWACNDPQSRWHGKIEICTGNLPADPYYYVVAAQAEPSSYRLLHEVNQFIRGYLGSPEREAIERKWQGKPVPGNLRYVDEPGGLMGEPDLARLWHAANPTSPRIALDQ